MYLSLHLQWCLEIAESIKADPGLVMAIQQGCNVEDAKSTKFLANCPTGAICGCLFDGDSEYLCSREIPNSLKCIGFGK